MCCVQQRASVVSLLLRSEKWCHYWTDGTRCQSFYTEREKISDIWTWGIKNSDAPMWRRLCRTAIKRDNGSVVLLRANRSQKPSALKAKANSNKRLTVCPVMEGCLLPGFGSLRGCEEFFSWICVLKLTQKSKVRFLQSNEDENTSHSFTASWSISVTRFYTKLLRLADFMQIGRKC